MTMATPSTRKSTSKAVQPPVGAEGSAETAHAAAQVPAKRTTAAKAAKVANAAARAASAPKATGAAKTGKVSKTTKAASVGKPRAKPHPPAKTQPPGAAAEQKTKRAKKEKVVRDSFTMPKSDYDKIAALKQKCLDAGVAVKKSELLRAGLLLLEGIPVDRLLEAIAAVETVKTGRPAKRSDHDPVQQTH
jgi:hypothetical protein